MTLTLAQELNCLQIVVHLPLPFLFTRSETCFCSSESRVQSCFLISIYRVQLFLNLLVQGLIYSDPVLWSGHGGFVMWCITEYILETFQ